MRPPILVTQEIAFEKAKRINECVKAHICPECGEGLTYKTAVSHKTESVKLYRTHIFFAWEVLKCECGFYHRKSLGIK